jgi:hypothetical protein
MGTVPIKPTPAAGDVILVRSPGKEALLNCLGQSLADPYAALRTPMFSHAAMVLDESFVVESYTTPEEDDTSWSGAPLGEGVRLRLLPDLLFSAVNTVVWRAPTPLSVPNELDTNSPLMIALIGSKYSIARLRVAMASRAALGSLVNLVAGKRLDEWTSTPDDLGTKMGLDPEFRAQVSALLPGLVLPPAAQDFFCSDLVAKLLVRAQALPSNAPGMITPTGLHRYLPMLGWSEVTQSDYGEATSHYALISKASWTATYFDRMAIIGLARPARALSAASDAIEGMFGKMEDVLDRAEQTIALEQRVRL